MSYLNKRNLFSGASLLLWLFAGTPTVYAALEWIVQPGGRSTSVDPGGSGKVGFQVVPGTGVQFTNVIPFERHAANQILLNGSGVTAGDVDGDGWVDLFFCGLGGRSAL